MTARRIKYGTGVADYWNFPVLHGTLEPAKIVAEESIRPGVDGIQYNDRGYHAPVCTLYSVTDVASASTANAAYTAYTRYVKYVVSVYDEREGYWPAVFVEDVRKLETFPIFAAVGQWNSAATATHILTCEWHLRVLDQ